MLEVMGTETFEDGTGSYDQVLKLKRTIDVVDLID